ncbi:hypothetical protein AAG570_010147 [Ranatra chinensis]|uniref:Uncharacterized protein n=1 Tax=Ranatra chinensis TaxID=642074 RepID=A0ABD0YLX1_9HEMI
MWRVSGGVAQSSAATGPVTTGPPSVSPPPHVIPNKSCRPPAYPRPGYLASSRGASPHHQTSFPGRYSASKSRDQPISSKSSCPFQKLAIFGGVYRCPEDVLRRNAKEDGRKRKIFLMGRDTSEGLRDVQSQKDAKALVPLSVIFCLVFRRLDIARVDNSINEPEAGDNGELHEL